MKSHALQPEHRQSLEQLRQRARAIRATSARASAAAKQRRRELEKRVANLEQQWQQAERRFLAILEQWPTHG